MSKETRKNHKTKTWKASTSFIGLGRLGQKEHRNVKKLKDYKKTNILIEIKINWK